MTPGQQTVQYTVEGAVTISYSTLVSSPSSLGASIDEAFGSHPKSLGIIIVRDLPPLYAERREKLLKLAYKFAHLDESSREKYADPGSKYSFGWSHGKEIMNGKPDLLKGSYYGNPILDNPLVSASERAAFPEYYGRNIWPSVDEHGVENLESAFKDLGKFIFQVGCELAAACQPFGMYFGLFRKLNTLVDWDKALPRLSNPSMSLPKLISTSQTTKARLLHYFPPTSGSITPAEEEETDSWCGFHLDHSMLTGLCSAMYLQEAENTSTEPSVVSSPSPASGLYICTRGGDLTKVSIPPDALAFQTGEALEVATGGKLRATPHCVRAGASPGGERITRETFALFMQPNTDQHLSDTLTFGEFSKQVLKEHYDDTQ